MFSSVTAIAPRPDSPPCCYSVPTASPCSEEGCDSGDICAQCDSCCSAGTEHISTRSLGRSIGTRTRSRALAGAQPQSQVAPSPLAAGSAHACEECLQFQSQSSGASSVHSPSVSSQISDTPQPLPRSGLVLPGQPWFSYSRDSASGDGAFGDDNEFAQPPRKIPKIGAPAVPHHDHSHDHHHLPHLHDPLALERPTDIAFDGNLYCHWDDHDHDEEFKFSSPTELDRHLKSAHLNSDALLDADGFFCHWDACHTNVDFLDELWFHIKKDHIQSSGHLPHQECLPEKVVPANEACESKRQPDQAGSSTATQPDSVMAPMESESELGSDLIYQSLTPEQILKCHWNECDFLSRDSLSLDNHLLHEHIEPQLHPRPLQPVENGFVNPYQCEWNSCHYESKVLEDMVTHLKTDHSVLSEAHESGKSKFALPEIKTEPIESPPSHCNCHGHDHDHDHNHDHSHSHRHCCRWKLDDGSICGHDFDTPKELSTHLVDDHIGSRKTEYSCMWEGCERNCRSFRQRQKIIRHLQIHSKYRPYQCKVCGNSFGEESVLKQHMRIHSGERPYVCKVCSKTFAASTALSVHMRTHTGEKPLVCRFPGCDKRFSESSNLAKHMKTHYRKGEREFVRPARTASVRT